MPPSARAQSLLGVLELARDRPGVEPLGRDVAIAQKTDPAILGGLIVKIGSQLIDGSIRTKLNTLAHAMKG